MLYENIYVIDLEGFVAQKIRLKITIFYLKKYFTENERMYFNVNQRIGITRKRVILIYL